MNHVSNHYILISDSLRIISNHYESFFEIQKPHFGHFVNSGDSQNWIFTRFLWLVQNTFGDSIPLWICTSTTFPSQNDDKLQSLMVQNDPKLPKNDPKITQDDLILSQYHKMTMNLTNNDHPSNDLLRMA